MAPAPKNDALSKWRNLRRHEITLPSGMKVEVEIPNLRMLIKTGQIPNSLIEAAGEAAASGNTTPSAELIEQQDAFYAKLVAVTVKVPEISEEDVADLPFEDIELIADIATRQTDRDATGRHIAGIELVEEYAAFRS